MLKKIVAVTVEMKSLGEMVEVVRPFVSYLRVKAMRHQTVKKMVLPQGKVEEYRRLFQLLDVNANGALDLDELRKGLEYHSSSEVVKLLSQYDFDKNKELQFFEFLRMVAPDEYAIPQSIEDEYKQTSPKYTSPYFAFFLNIPKNPFFSCRSSPVPPSPARFPASSSICPLLSFMILAATCT